MNFYVPPSLSDDFANMLEVFGVDVVINYNNATPVTTKMQFSNPDFKSNYQNLSDSARIVRFKLTDTVLKGDYLTDADNITYLLTWKPFKDINSYKSQCQECNCELDFEAWQAEVIGSTGIVVTPAKYVNIAENVRCFTARNKTGIFEGGLNDVGIVPKSKLMVGMQYNTNTQNIDIGDEFSFRNVQYLITDIDYSQLHDTLTTGCLVIFAEQLEGGRRNV